MKKAFLIIAVISIYSCKKENRYDKINNASWVVGRWENASRAGLLVETWKKQDDSTYIGSSAFMVGNETKFFEKIKLEQHDTIVTYTATVKDQNNGEPVSFNLTSATKTQLVFENPGHDFPQKIIYNLVGNDSLIAEISGAENGQPKTETFRMKKQLNP
ncbi:MAG: hypothetical protein CFE23_03185 [Flavobacterium sp. BFFFF1]|uniref:DUF6265 family protein n=1 Tax=Flavobacterium sp. BFFFF1 TaxID=2015557 RepID=UPI000BCDFEC8|nr:DUF6265 family protein [Flavobacterium sp. BFFFF1]OYU81892.1 MAG: hypothetical protein CFE23_03185 [Flavobacterium sp. BFFFF1]